jgi:S1-C subfamily serine protease
VVKLLGIWEHIGSAYDYKIAIILDDYIYRGTVLESSNKEFKPGSEKVTFETSASDKILTIKWFNSINSINPSKSVAKNDDNLLITFRLPNTSSEWSFYRTYPKKNSSKEKKASLKTGEWAGNGSGIIISKSGYIVTNYHVIDDADEIEVEFILNGELQKLNAEIVQVDKVNDLAILRIFDMNFDGLDDLPYNFQSRSSDVGTTVYAYGYPMALTAMGKEIKVTDGIINSKSGFQGDITTYQISAPIQGGNSGGPLFDDQGNFIGINSAVIRKDIADNVGYTIKSSYVLSLIDVLPKSIELPSSTELKSLPLTEQIKQISKFVVLIKTK